MMTRAVALILLVVCSLLRAESVLPENIQQGKLIPSTTSPDGKYCLLEVFHSDTTQNSIIIATTDRKQNLGPVSVHTGWSTDKPHKGRTTVLWSPDSKRFVVHDSFPKHSRVFIHRLTAAGFEQLTTHDILAAACGHFGIKLDSVVSSGQLPTKWPGGDLVQIEVSVRLKNGKKLRHTFPIHAPLQGPSIQQ
jgi:hypothetical protein